MHTEQNTPVTTTDPRPFVAEIYDVETGDIYDMAWTWEAGQAYARDTSYLVIAIAGDGHMTNGEAQSLYDYERRLSLDCFA